MKFLTKDVSGDWQNTDKISSIDLNSQALSSEFNSTNSAFTILPKIALPAQDDSSAPMPENSIPLLKEETAPIESTPTEELKSSTSPENEPVSSPEEEIAVPPAPEEKSVEIPAQNDQPPTTHPPTETPSQLPEPPPASPSQGGPASPPASTPGENQGGPASPPPTSQSLIEKPFSFLHRFLYGGLILALNDGESPVTDEKGKPDKEKAPVSQEKIAADQPPPQDESSTSPPDASENDKSPVSPSQPEQKTNPSKDEPASPSEDNSSPGKPDGNADQNEEKATNKEKEGVESQVTQPTETETESTEAPPPPEIILPTVGDEGALAQPTEPQEKISIFTSRKKLMLSGFKPEEERDAVSPIETIKLRLSMNITSKFNEDDELLVGYKVGENGIWSQLASFTQDQEYSNFKNGDYFSYELPIDTNLQDLSVEIFSLSNNDPDILGYEPPPIYIDAAWVEVDYIDEVAAPAVLEEVNQEEEYSVDYDETPQFEFYFKNDDRATLDRLISLAVRSRNFKITEVKLLHETGFEYEADADIQQEADGKWIVKIPNSDRKTIPGKYKVKITGVEDGQQYIEEQDFYWGVLAVNVNKSILLPGEDAYIQMAALTDKGVTICDANLKLDITVPDGTVVSPEVQRSGECKLDADIVDVPDYFVHYAANELGSYEMKLSRLDGDGAEIHHISSSFEVQDAVPFEVERTGPTRIFPLAKYKMKFTVKTNKDFTGNIIEHLPNSFAITENPEYAIQNGGSETRIFWNLDLKAGDVKQLSYEFDAPDTSPEFYLLGPLKIGEWNEARFWQIAADATATYDFVGCGATCDTSTDWWASQDDVDLFPFGGVQANRNTHLEATDAQYDLIDTSDNLRWTATDPGAGDQTLLWVEMKVDQTAASITQIDLTFEGLLANGDTTANGQMYVLKTGTAYETDANWVAVGATLSLTTTDTSFTRSITSNFTDYIGADGIITWALDNNASSTSIVTDYVKTVVTYTPS
ncbi:MAG: hypothetical protein HYR95_02945, partial [Candidatus Colwellbacteria bacterium]|nr:hypothetical protein [Candidatus Colwellbacteria bacterium]